VNISWFGIKSRIHIHTYTGYETDILASLNMLSVLSVFFFFVGKRTGRHYSCNCGESIPLYRCSVPGSSSRIPLIVVPPRATIDDLERGRLLGFFPTLLFVGSRETRGEGSSRYMHLYRDKRGVYVPPHDSGSDDARSVKTLVDRYRCRRWFMRRSSYHKYLKFIHRIDEGRRRRRWCR